MHALIAYLLSAMMSWAPPASHDYYAPREETTERYESIARDVAEVALDPNEAPLFGGPQGRAQTALVLMSIANFESGGFRRDVDLGMGPRGRGDSGRSWCLMQINVGEGKTTERWTGRELVEDRRRCFRAGLERIRQSFALCEGMPLLDRLSGYTRGRCEANDETSRHRLQPAMTWWTRHNFDDESSREQALAQ